MSTKGYDAEDASGKRYEIKAQRLTAHNDSRMLSAIRDCEAAHFDYLAGVLFNEDFSLAKACIIPFNIVLAHSKYRKHTNAHIFELKDELWALPGVSARRYTHVHPPEDQRLAIAAWNSHSRHKIDPIH